MVQPFTLVAQKLKSLAEQCSFNEPTIFTARHVSSMTHLFTVAATDNSALFGDYLLPGENRRLLVQVPCSSINCQQLEMDLNLTLSPHTSRLLPYGSLLGDNSVANIDDSSVTVLAYQAIPVFDGRHTQIYVSHLYSRT